jgi:hypothetical protein
MDSIKVVWTDPVVLADGSALPAGDLAHVSVELSADAGASFVPVANVLPGVGSFVQTGLVPGTYQFRLTPVDAQTPPVSGASVVVAATIPVPVVVLAAPGPVTGASAAPV